MTKFCTKCKQNKPTSEFRIRSENSNKLRSQCKECLNRASNRYNQVHQEQIRANSRKTRERAKTDAKLRYAFVKWRLKEKMQLTEQEYCNIFKEDPPCIYCGSTIRAIGSGLDRIDNSKIYTVDNVNPCCGTCNDIRGDNLSVEEMKVAMKAILTYRRSLL